MHAWLHLASPTDPDTATWWLENGEPEQGDLHQAAARLAGLRLTLLLPAEAASLHRVQVPSRSGRWLRQALDSALEEVLLEELDALHLARGALVDRQCRVIAVDRQWLRELLARLAGFGLVPARIHVDADCLPPEEPCALPCAGRCLLGGDPALFGALQEARLGELAALLPDGLRRLEQAPWPLLADGSRRAIDLRQGEFAKRGGQRPGWALAAGLLVVACAAQGVQDRLHRHWLERDTAEFQQANQAEWQQRFPGEPLVDLGRQLQARQASSGRSAKGVGQELHELAATWSASGGSLAQVRQLDYRADEGWTLRVEAGSFADIERLREGLLAQGLNVQADSSTRSGEGVSTRLRITR
ncbi:type II secretion system protein GspL [Pseudomonas sp. USHLN015]|uniref:type II secretion system protein GspL n=1 Tax=Pseudomonas sp. USHLN015 TaxID=3081296 RepID=UPI00301C47DC